jgi:photosystem II stability/assembly factor-like uncharacterized protein
VLRSTNRGLSWQRAVDVHVQDSPITDVAVDPTDAQVVYAAADAQGLFKTLDGGASWAPLSIAGVPHDSRVRCVVIHPQDPQHVLVGIMYLGIFASVDGSQSWQPAYAGLEPNGVIEDIVFDPTNPMVVYAADRMSGVYRSTDGGLQWIKINSGLDNRSAVGLGISADGQHVYAGIDGAGVYRLDVDGEAPAAPYRVYLPVVLKQLSSGV